MSLKSKAQPIPASELIKNKMAASKFNVNDIATLTNIDAHIVNDWLNGKSKPTKTRLEKILSLPETFPFECDQTEGDFKFIDLFAGIGGIRLPFQKNGGKCVFSSEWDRFAQLTYATNFGDVPHGDITLIPAKEIPDHDLLLGGFPCQAFSQAGLKQGFNDTRGTMFFEIQRIIAEKKPRAFMLENVKQLIGHQKGQTLKTILNILRGIETPEISDDVPMSEDARLALNSKLNYWVDFKVLRAGDFGIPQNRERVFIVGFDKSQFPENFNFDKEFSWPIPPMLPTRVGDILEDEADDSHTISDRLWEGHQRRKEEHKTKGNGFGYSIFTPDSPYANTISARYYKDGSEILIDQSGLGKNPRKLTSRECARLQGFPENYIVDAVSQGQMYKQFGNSVCMRVIEALAKEVTTTLKKGHVKHGLKNQISDNLQLDFPSEHC